MYPSDHRTREREDCRCLVGSDTVATEPTAAEPTASLDAGEDAEEGEEESGEEGEEEEEGAEEEDRYEESGAWEEGEEKESREEGWLCGDGVAAMSLPAVSPSTSSR